MISNQKSVTLPITSLILERTSKKTNKSLSKSNFKCLENFSSFELQLQIFDQRFYFIILK